MNDIRHAHKVPKIGFSGSASTEFLKQEDLDLCMKAGAEVVRQGGVLVTGATTGTPLWAARGAKEAGGTSIGLSPARDEKEHVGTYELPLDYMDVIIYTGFGYSGRDLLFTRSSDAMIIGPGRIGTIHEFTISFEDHKPVGIMEGDNWETDEVLKFLIEKSHREQDNKKVFFERDPVRLVSRLLEFVKADKEGHL
ncbi:MAG: hypothetical protein COV10_00740 [Candidatus Vogelbacteria bacterium CG10_big_fil_rev_8_21_14_0_10_51_16]|uniref:TIGR00725 family protein n=1 Tax=Candidatus Vogelbacteria bacterium CG10_big_fil_rev_8_21_14_0_10_51_16 TaxID=1975045 RepID=A0A2H0RFA0_9BACT|nr:MAG: hypothetical protein COV10_00740 [Candidatus Vogelbacteria bacterium CG10_big_fil_rev_8_21_14_0_10_51_16]